MLKMSEEYFMLADATASAADRNMYDNKSKAKRAERG